MNDNPAQDPQSSNSYVDEYQPPVVGSSPSPSSPSSNSVVVDPVELVQAKSLEEPSESASANQSETLEDQNVFFMLGVDNGSDELKENFLNELQQVIWDDFLENDVSLLITSDEKVKFDEIMVKKDDAVGAGKNIDEIQDVLIGYLETLIPDLEDIMLEKALDLKADLYVERINSMREYHTADADNLEKINTVEKMMNEDKWYSSAELLNQLEAK